MMVNDSLMMVDAPLMTKMTRIHRECLCTVMESHYCLGSTSPSFMENLPVFYRCIRKAIYGYNQQVSSTSEKLSAVPTINICISFMVSGTTDFLCCGYNQILECTAHHLAITSPPLLQHQQLPVTQLAANQLGVWRPAGIHTVAAYNG